MFYLIRTPWIVRKCYPECIWRIPGEELVIYLTFDDGPHPDATPAILVQLKRFNAKATFFCIGKNVAEQPQLYRRILEEGHRVGNHTHNHLNGWKTRDREYLQNIADARHYIDSNLFRPPYGRISKFQIANLRGEPFRFKVIMWDVLSADFDQKQTAERCVQNVVQNAGNGSIVVFHDSAKTFERMNESLPKVLEHFSSQGYQFRAIQ
jgi:peptidoglycan/xylan/chitin deacetylase (PgdA/CDA1 family)